VDVRTDEQQAKLAELAQQIAEVEARPAGVGQEHPAGTSSADRRSPAGPWKRGRAADTGGAQPDGSTGGLEPGDQRTRAQHEAAARAICLRLLAIAPRPRAGLAQALERKDIPLDVATAVLDRFTEIGLIDDAAYARSFVRVKHRDRALGRAKLRTELRRLGVADEIMSDAVQVVDTEAERVRAAELIDKRIDAAMEAGPVAARRRLLGLLDRRGYPAEVAIPVVESALQDYRGDAEQSY
jgi:regulatory protein